MKYIANQVEVDAFKIVGAGPVLEDGSMHLAIENGDNVTASPQMLSRYTPTAGDYIVVQSDGYAYINPAEVFERKYRPAETAPEIIGEDALCLNCRAAGHKDSQHANLPTDQARPCSVFGCMCMNFEAVTIPLTPMTQAELDESEEEFVT